MSIASIPSFASIACRIAGVHGSGAEDADLERRAFGSTLPLHLLGDRQHVRRRHHDDVGLEVGDQLHLLLGLAAGHRDHRAAQLLAVVRPQTAGEQPVAVGDVHDVAGAPAGARIERAITVAQVSMSLAV